MTLLEWTTLIVFLSPLFQILFHAVAARVLREKTPQLIVCYAILGCGFFLFLAHSLLWSVDPAPKPGNYLPCLAYFFIGYSSIAISYFHLFNLSETGRRIKILYELLQSGSLKEEELKKRYGTEEIILVRIERLCATRQLKKGVTGYLLNSALLLSAARITTFWHSLLGFAKPNV